VKTFPFCRVLVLLLSVSATTFAATTITVGINPQDLAVNSITNRIYVSNLTDNSVSVIDGSSNTVVDTISVGAVPEQIAVNSRTNMIYVANSSGDTINAIDGSTDIVVATIPSAGTVFLAVNPVTNRIYAGNQVAQTVTVIDGSTNTVITTIAIPGEGVIPEALAVNSNSNLIYLALDSFENNKSITVISGTTNTIIHTIPLPDGAGINGMAADLELSRIYIVDSSLKAIYVFNTKANAVVGTVSLPDSHFPFAAAVEPSHEIVVSDYTDGTLIRINPWNLSVDGSSGNGRGPSGIAVNPITQTLYVSDTFSNVVTVISLNAI
jgi:YVTN family beta-propeller protein